MAKDLIIMQMRRNLAISDIQYFKIIIRIMTDNIPGHITIFRNFKFWNISINDTYPYSISKVYLQTFDNASSNLTYQIGLISLIFPGDALGLL